jgi:hypothetical protein
MTKQTRVRSTKAKPEKSLGARRLHELVNWARSWHGNKKPGHCGVEATPGEEVHRQDKNREQLRLKSSTKEEFWTDQPLNTKHPDQGKKIKDCQKTEQQRRAIIAEEPWKKISRKGQNLAAGRTSRNEGPNSRKPKLRPWPATWSKSMAAASQPSRKFSAGKKSTAKWDITRLTW